MSGMWAPSDYGELEVLSGPWTPPDLDGATALVTGSAAGVRTAIARRTSRSGRPVVLC